MRAVCSILVQLTEKVEVAEESLFHKVALFQLVLLFCLSHQTALTAFWEALMVISDN